MGRVNPLYFATFLLLLSVGKQNEKPNEFCSGSVSVLPESRLYYVVYTVKLFPPNRNWYNFEKQRETIRIFLNKSLIWKMHNSGSLSGVHCFISYERTWVMSSIISYVKMMIIIKPYVDCTLIHCPLSCICDYVSSSCCQ